MGGREVGGLANQLATHLDLEEPDVRSLVQGFWKLPHIADRPGLKAVEFFQAVGDGRIKALWIMATNPVDSLPDADRVKRALAKCPLVVVSEVVAANDTLPFAHVRLPAAAWGEKDGHGDQLRVLHLAATARFCRSARRGRTGGSSRRSPGGWVSPLPSIIAGRPKSSGSMRRFEPRQRRPAPARSGRLRRSQWRRLRRLSVQWPRPRGAAVDARRVFADGRFATPDERARFVATPHRTPVESVSPDFPVAPIRFRRPDHRRLRCRSAWVLIRRELCGLRQGRGLRRQSQPLDPQRHQRVQAQRRGYRPDRTGLSVSSAGDIDGDGFDDMLISGYRRRCARRQLRRQDYVVFGFPASGFPANFDLWTTNGSNGFQLNGITRGEYSGTLRVHRGRHQRRRLRRHHRLQTHRQPPQP